MNAQKAQIVWTLGVIVTFLGLAFYQNSNLISEHPIATAESLDSTQFSQAQARTPNQVVTQPLRRPSRQN